MKFLHLSDLHLGKRVNGFSMLEDQEFILKKILQIVDAQKPDAVVIAGDVYDKSVPSGEAVTLLDRFLFSLVKRNLQVALIAGNHDSPERLAFGGRLLRQSGIHISPVYDGSVSDLVMTDEHGPVHFWLLPFIKPAHVRAFLGEEAASVSNETDAVRLAIAGTGFDPRERNVLICHQFVTGASRSDSEEVSVGGSDNVDAEVFEGFDYVALGHLHGPQNVGSERIRYCGTPLKYSFSEKDHVKSVTVVTLGEKGSVEVCAVPLEARRDLREIRGTYEELTLRKNYEGTNTDDYVHLILTDEQDVPDVAARLRTVYPNLMKIDYDNTRTRTQRFEELPADADRRPAAQLVADFYEIQNGQKMGAEPKAYCEKLLEKIEEELS